MNIAGYLEKVIAKYQTGQATEHSYRPALQDLFESIDPALTVINEPKRSDAGMPDFIFQRKDVPVGWVEAKDIDKDVIALKGYSKEQRQRYERAYPNLIYTNGVDFEFIREGASVHYVSIADFVMGLQPKPEKFDELARQLQLFAAAKPISIISAARLAEFMAAKAAIIKDEIDIALGEDPDFRTGLGGQFKSFKQNLLPALTPGEFADIYAETITYGMFAARFHDTDLTTFSRQESMERLPASNPFLKGLFEYIAGPQLPPRLKYIVDDLVEVMRASDPHSLFRDYGKFTARNDPFIHFYEDFLGIYNPKKKKERGVWYTPEPVVDFIVRAVDDVLKSEFGLADGLADTSKVTVDWDTGTNHPKTGKPLTEKREVHKVQILDPATGTGTFLAKAVQLISDRVKVRAPGMWSSYVEKDLLPRLHGFELLMASYAMCHMKLDMQLTESGYTPGPNPPRLSVWLTNALEPAEREVRDLFFEPLAVEARGASEVKRQTPIMCVIGNPPYSGESANKGDHIKKLMGVYKMEPGGKEKLKERNPKWINDDYVKFIRMSENLIASNPSGGVLGFITNHGYLDNPTFRGMRWHLLKTFDKIWVLDLHGNVKKKEVSPDGSPDKNVFDIQQGVALIIAVRKGAGSEELAQVWHGDLWGNRKAKYTRLASADLDEQDCSVQHIAPYFFLRPFDASAGERWNSSFNVPELFVENSVGIVTANDPIFVGFNREETIHIVSKRLGSHKPEFLQPELYRPFDKRVLYFDVDRLARSREPISKQFLRSNVGLTFMRPTGAAVDLSWGATDAMIDQCAAANKSAGGGITYQCPLYLYPDGDEKVDNHESGAEARAAYLEAEVANRQRITERTLNLDPKLHAAICAAAGIDPADTDMAREQSPSPSGEGKSAQREGVGAVPPTQRVYDNPHPNPSPEGEGLKASFRTATGDARPSEVKVFDYIYGVLHSPDYRRTFAEFLKIDFPRVPYPPSPEVFRHVSEKGEALRRLHLMEDAAIGDTPYPLMGDGRGDVASGYPKFDAGKVFINTDQYFDGVPLIAWEFHIGGYLPAQKWLKDRRGRTLGWDDIGHYQKIVKILIETARIMGEIELPLEGGG